MADHVESPKKSVFLEALQWQGARNDCGPYTVATVINALTGTNIKAAELAKEMNRPAWRGPLFIVRRVPNWATFPWGMVDVFRQHGLPARWRAFRSEAYLRAALERGDVVMPILGEWRPLWAHVMTLVAWDNNQGWGFANTQYKHHNIDWWDADTVSKQWLNMGRMVVEIKHA